MVAKREITIWISAFVTFLAILCSVATVVMLITEGSGYIVRPYIIGDLLGGIADLSVESYLAISVTATFIFLGITCIIVFRKEPPDPELLQMLVTVAGNVAALKKTHEDTMTEIASQMEYDRSTSRKLFNKINLNLEDASKESLALLEGQGKAIKKARRDLISIIENKANETGEKLSTTFKEQEKIMVGVKQSSEKGTAALRKQKAELKEIKLRLEEIEDKIVPIQAKLKSLDDIEEINGIGPRFGEELRSLGITSIRDFLTADPVVIGEKTRLSQEVAENLQVMAQLQMIPGITQKDAELLAEAGIKSRKELAGQDSIQLSRKVGEIAKIYVDQGKLSKDDYPTIEEISSWIRMA
jgi:predicted flap endonuclease-1-like 5' DNA nuclease